ncbi:MAG: DegT/DnrJ/EryC1/StrS family aminotransferase, partial [Gammaproteobacteria bacterium]
MKIHLSSLRPVGNAILSRKAPLDHAHFANLDIQFYQSGTAALAAGLIATRSLHKNVTNTPEVILPAYACPDLISACIFAGVTPVLVDFEPDSCWMSLAQVENVVTQNTIGIIAVRFLGIAERMEQLQNICDRHGLSLIEDSAQGFPASHPESYWQGDLAILSFGRGKPVNLLGGGAILIRNSLLKKHIPGLKPGAETSQTGKLKYWSKIHAFNLLIRPLIYGIATQLPGLHIGETAYKTLAGLNTIQAQTLAYMNANITQYQQQSQIANHK